MAATDDTGAQGTEGDTPVEDMPSGEIPPTELTPDPNSQPGKAVTVNGITVTGPTRENFDSEEAWQAYEDNWHTDRSLPQKKATYENGGGLTWYAGEMSVDFYPGTTDERIAEIVARFDGTVVVLRETFGGKKYAFISVKDDHADMHALGAEVKAAFPDDVDYAVENGLCEVFDEGAISW